MLKVKHRFNAISFDMHLTGIASLRVIEKIEYNYYSYTGMHNYFVSTLL